MVAIKNRKPVAAMGSEVVILRGGKRETYCLCDRTDIGAHERRLDCSTSPLGVRLMGKKPGQKFNLPTPKGDVVIQIVEVIPKKENAAAA